MAEVKTIKINVDTKQAVNAMDNLAQATHDVSASFADVYGEIQPLTARMGEAEDRLYELASAGKTTTKEYQDLLKTVGDYRKVQIQTDMAVDAAATNMGQKLGGALGGVTAGFSLAQGVMGAFGVESEQLEKTLLKVQSALAIQQGLQGIKEAIPSFKALGTAAKNALAGIKTGIAATGIGLLVVALGTLVAYWDDIKSAVSGVSDEQTKLNEKTDANVLAQQAKYDSISGQDNILKLQGKSEQDILKIKKAQINAVITATEAQLVQQESTKKAQVAAAKRNNEILQGIITFLTAPLQLLLKTVDMVGSALGKDFGLQKGFTKGLANLVFDPEETAAEADKTIQETKNKLATLKNEAAGFEIALQQQSDKASQKASATTENKSKEELEKLAEYNKAATDLFQSEYDKQVEAIKKKYDEQIALAKKYNKDYKDLEAAQAKELEDALDKSMVKIETLSIAKTQIAERDLGGLRGSINTELQAKQEAADLEISILEAKASRAAKIEEQANSFKVKATLDGLSAIASISELFGKKSEKAAKRAFQVQKAANIATALISTYQNATSAYASQFTPIPTPDSPIRGAIAAGIAVASGLANVAKIGQQKFEGGTPVSDGGGGGGGGSIPSITPSFNVVGNSGVNQLAQLQQQPMQAYVVSGSVTTAQSLDRNRIENATL
jgi:hypothetical protein